MSALRDFNAVLVPMITTPLSLAAPTFSIIASN
nr:MAG TPA: hypothetical protein [Caudoviricetes sp.]